MKRRFVSWLMLAALGGCSMAPADLKTELPVPASWPVGDAYLKQSEAALPSYNHGDVFADPRLRAVIAQALANNQDLKRAAANIRIARAQYRIQHAELLPQIDASLGLRRSGGDGAADSTQASADAAISGYELDLFGRLQSLSGAAQDRYFASEAAARARAAMYAGSIRATYGKARYPGLSQYPGDGGTRCLTRCGCSLDERDDGIHWILDDSIENCEDCQAMAAGSPYDTTDR
jgi:multidrug efflux system outer membrane protein